MSGRPALVRPTFSLHAPGFPRFLLAASAAFATMLVAPPLQPAARAEDSVQIVGPVENSKNQFVGEVNASNVYVRSGPSENFYPTQRLSKGDRLTVVGIKNGWLKVVPPQGSFSYVAKAYVQRRGDGTVGRVNNTLNVRAGSKLNTMKIVVQTKLEPGADVKIVGDQDEYFIIEPPEGAYLFVDHRYVKPIEQVKPATPADEPSTPEVPLKTETPRPTDPDPTEPGEAEPGRPTTEPGEDPGTDGGEDAEEEAATQPGDEEDGQAAEATAELYKKLDAEFLAADAAPVAQQPVEDLLGRYEELARQKDLKPSQRAMVDARVTALRQRAQSRRAREQLRAREAEARQQQQALEAERQELAERVRQNQVKVYAAVGTLRVSSLQQGAETLYRLTDPASGRTVVYVRTNDPQYADMLNQFVGVKGTLENDRRLNLRVVTPTAAAEPVDPTSLGAGVVAQVVPPSMLSTATAAEPPQE